MNIRNILMYIIFGITYITGILLGIYRVKLTETVEDFKIVVRIFHQQFTLAKRYQQCALSIRARRLCF